MLHNGMHTYARTNENKLRPRQERIDPPPPHARSGKQSDEEGEYSLPYHDMLSAHERIDGF
jgi:hypothetical protein